VIHLTQSDNQERMLIMNYNRYRSRIEYNDKEAIFHKQYMMTLRTRSNDHKASRPPNVD
jgi:hypothetical protein